MIKSSVDEVNLPINGLIITEDTEFIFSYGDTVYSPTFGVGIVTNDPQLKPCKCLVRFLYSDTLIDYDVSGRINGETYNHSKIYSVNLNDLYDLYVKKKKLDY
jgi:hypothetical protein